MAGKLKSCHVQDIMRVLLGYISKDKQADALVEKLLARFSGPGALSRNLAFCLSQVRPVRLLADSRCQVMLVTRCSSSSSSSSSSRQYHESWLHAFQCCGSLYSPL